MTDIFRTVRRPGAVGITGGLVAAGLSVVATLAPANAGAGDCRVVELAQPDWGYDGGLVDIEVVDGQPVYYGSTHERDKRGVEHQRALIWRGLNARPIRVGPAGYDFDIAFELTESGLINGQSEDWETGREVAWVQDLDTMAVTILDTSSGPSGADHGRMWMRRINDAGSAVGTLARDQMDPWSDAVTFETPASPLDVLPGAAAAADSLAYGINNDSQKTGFLATREMPDAPGWHWFDPVVWQADGSITPMAVTGGLDAIPRAIKDDGSASGSMLYGQDIATGHIEPAYWPDPNTVVPLGVLPGGGFGDVFGMDEGGWLVGALDRSVKRNNRLGEFGTMNHAFLRTPDTTEGHLRILPSLYATAKREADWHKWAGTAVHAVNGELNQVGSGSHVEFRHGRPMTAPTVWVNADRCGVEVATTHDPFGLQQAAGGTSARRPVGNVPRAVRSWKRSVRP